MAQSHIERVRTLLQRVEALASEARGLKYADGDCDANDDLEEAEDALDGAASSLRQHLSQAVDDADPMDIDPDTNRFYPGYSSPSLDTSFHDHEMNI